MFQNNNKIAEHVPELFYFS